MQLVLSKSNYVEKILHDKDGRLVRATFCVYENGGRIKARLVDVVYLDEYQGLDSKTSELFGFVAKQKIENVCDSVFDIVSPYFSNILYFSGSKPRAPTF
jgi:hypothetical protein